MKNKNENVIFRVMFTIMAVLIMLFVPYAWIVAVIFVTIRMLLSIIDSPKKRHHRRR